MNIENQYNLHFGWVNYPIQLNNKRQINKKKRIVEPIEKTFKSNDSTTKQHIDIYI